MTSLPTPREDNSQEGMRIGSRDFAGNHLAIQQLGICVVKWHAIATLVRPQEYQGRKQFASSLEINCMDCEGQLLTVL